MRKRGLLIGISITSVVSTVLVSFAWSAEGRAVLHPSGAVVERLTDRVPTKGNFLAGIHLGRGEGLFRVDDVGLALAPRAMGRQVCLRAATRDGRFWYQAPYTVGADSPSISFVEFASKYGAQLQRFETSGFSFNARLADTCEEASEGTLVPTRPPGATDTNILVALVNPGESRVQMQLLGSTEAHLRSEKVKCERIHAGSLVTFSQICTVSLVGMPKGEVMRLEFTVIELTDGRSVVGYDVLVPNQ